MNAEATARDPYLDLSLHGLHLIEASAGTGKTFTLATLVTRLLIERGWRIGQILAMTFTEAATQELRKRIRERLLLAARLVDAPPTPDESAETGLTRALIQRHLADSQETPAALHRRLQAAADEIDLAAIFTIHGFCARVLREHALESGQAFDPPQLIASERELHEELAADLWRVHAADTDSFEALLDLWNSPQALASDMRALVGALPLLPEPQMLSPDPRQMLADAATQLAIGFRAEGEAYFAQILSARESGVLNKSSYRADWIAPLCRHLFDWSQTPDPFVQFDERLQLLTLEALTAKINKPHAGKTPLSPLQPLVAGYVVARDAYVAWRRQQSVLLLHRLRDEARARLRQLKQVRRLQTYDDLIEGVAAALEGPHGELLAQRLREQYRVALVDEFQDTDERQWGIFQRVFSGGSDDAPHAQEAALFLIGDPKQAIYGFRGGDVRTYLRAAAVAEPAPALAHNFRSRPALLCALETLYTQAGDDAFLEQDIRFHPVRPGGTRSDADYLRNGRPAPALTVRLLPAAADGKAHSAGSSHKLATDACVAAIHALLGDARAGRASLDGRLVQPGDIAVLVRKHREATCIQRALALAGISAVAAGKQSLFATEEAQDLLALLAALLQPADEGRLRAALATVLLGLDAADIAALEHDGESRRLHQLDALQWRERWQRSGPFALVSDLCAAQAERLLGLLDGERRLTNYLQLGELLQQADARALGLHGLVDWLYGRIAGADDDDEEQQLRLESDARRVQIVTLHKSKGLEYPLVFLPFAGIGGKPFAPERRVVVHDGRQRALHWKIDKDAPDWKAARNAAAREQEAEDARLLYVGLTRAEHALWLATGPFYNHHGTRLAPMLADLSALVLEPGIEIDAAELPIHPIPLPAGAERAVPPARQVLRTMARDWWVYSFTQLAHADSGVEAGAIVAEERGADDESVLPEAIAADAVATETFDMRFGGSRFGNALHDALEHSDFRAWSDWRVGGTIAEAALAPLRNALRDGGYADADLDDGVAALVPLVGQTLTVPLPEGTRLCDLPATARRAEIEFHFAMQPTSIEALLAILHAHGVIAERRGFGPRRQLEGLMTGKIDLTYTVDGRWYVLDYKSNRLSGYERADLERAMVHSEYDLQALIYTLALHRWLRFRLGGGYDYTRDFGGVRYLFCRGLDATRADSPGLHARIYPAALVDALDRLFAGGEAGQAALVARAGAPV